VFLSESKFLFMAQEDLLFKYWNILYPESDQQLLTGYLEKIKRSEFKKGNQINVDDWYKDAIVYSLYIDLFNSDFNGLIEKLDYLENLGVNCLWLLPILDSPMRDAGFDIRNYDRIRADLLGLTQYFTKADQEQVFGHFLSEAHARKISVIFDIAINHCSNEHPWFVEACKSEDSPFRNYFIWTKDTRLYSEARLLFKGIEGSNWEANKDGWHYFHRFFSFQPDLNYRNADVLLSMCNNLLYWQSMGVDGFRADAIPYLWKEEGTVCENLENTHIVVKFFRAMLDYVKPGSLILAEACQKPKNVVKYLGDGDECHAAYHFPLMPMMFKAIAAENGNPVKETLSPTVTPDIPENAQWFTFLRVHDELSLELVYVSEEDRKFIHENYCLKPEWDFRVGEGISARLSELMKRDVAKIGLAYSLMLTLTGTPVIYYGDEFGKLNDEKYYAEQIRLTGKDDTRFLVRGRIDWDKLEMDLQNEENFHSRVFNMISNMLKARKSMEVFGRGKTSFLNSPDYILSYLREMPEENVLVVNNLSSLPKTCDHPFPEKNLIILHSEGFLMDDEKLQMKFDPHGFAWFAIV
jgi:maltose alpha-D-glucosyltransferase / alpha-amylase